MVERERDLSAGDICNNCSTERKCDGPFVSQWYDKYLYSFSKKLQKFFSDLVLTMHTVKQLQIFETDDWISKSVSIPCWKQ